MTGKRWAVAAGAVALACLVLAVAAVALRPPPRGVSKENFDRVELGMPREAIHDLFGGPANSTSPGGRSWSEIAGIQGSRRPDGAVSEVWGGDHGAAIIDFDDQGRTVRKHWIDASAGFIANVLRAFGL
jgi:hypothetical protein